MLNRIVIHGRLTRDPELRYTQSQVPVGSFTVAVDRDFSDSSGNRETDFIDCTIWRQGAEILDKYFRKGQLILVEGRMQSRKWTDKDGNKRVSWGIEADRIYFGEPKREDNRESDYGRAPARQTSAQAAQQQAAQQGQPQDFVELGDGDGELPF